MADNKKAKTTKTTPTTLRTATASNLADNEACAASRVPDSFYALLPLLILFALHIYIYTHIYKHCLSLFIAASGCSSHSLSLSAPSLSHSRQVNAVAIIAFLMPNVPEGSKEKQSNNIVQT